MPQFHMHLGPSFRHTSSSWTFSLSNAGASPQWKLPHYYTDLVQSLKVDIQRGQGQEEGNAFLA